MQTYITLLEKLIRMRPVSDNIEAVNAVQETLRSFLKERGVLCTMEELNGKKILYASTCPGKTPDLLLNAHVDVVPVEDDSQFEPVIKDGWMHARGAGDCLGNAVCFAKVLCEAEKNLSIGAIFSADEEIGGATTEFMTANGYAGRRLVCIVDGKSDAVSYAQKGTMNVKLSAAGISGHASRPFNCDNAADKLISGYAKFRAQWQNPTADDSWHNSMALTVMKSGIIANKIPDYAEMIINFRYIAQPEREKILNALRDITGLDVELLSFRDPVVADKDAPELKVLAQIMQKHLDKEPLFYRMDGATDASFFVNGPAPVAILGTNSADAHGRLEKVELDSIAKYAEILKETAKTLSV